MLRQYNERVWPFVVDFEQRNRENRHTQGFLVLLT